MVTNFEINLLYLNFQLTYGAPQNTPGGSHYPPYGAPAATGYPPYGGAYGGGPSGPIGSAIPPPIGFNPSVVQGAGACKIRNFVLLFKVPIGKPGDKSLIGRSPISSIPIAFITFTDIAQLT